ncbi:ribonuclease H-like domain-containing protein [Tanacetum coccineum]
MLALGQREFRVSYSLYIEDPDPVTLISKLDISDPLHLHPNDTTALTVVSIKLKGTKIYQVWLCAMLLALEGKNKIGFIDETCKRSITDEMILICKLEDIFSIEKFYLMLEVHMLLSLVRNLTELLLNLSNGSRPSNLNNNSQGGGSGLVCENCGFNGHTIDRCFKIIGYPADFGKKKSNQGNQHMTYTDKELDNIIDISHFKIKVGHPNGTEAFISKIENLKLSNALILYDVLVILEYYVTLISVHKLAKENKVIVAFDENKCYFLNQDLSLRSVLGTGSQCEGLYYYNNQGPYKVTSSEGFRYFLTVVDDYTRAVWVYLIKSKDEVSHIITIFYNLIENQFKRKINVFKSDNGTEFVNQTINKLCADKGIIHQTSCAYTPQQNGIVERKHSVAVVVRDFYKKFYNSLGSVPNRCSAV